MSNLRHWAELEKTDPKYTKQFSRPGGFKGTAQNPTYAIKKMTNHFGPAGVGWGLGKPEFTLVHGQDGEVLVYCVLELWYIDGDIKAITYGVGGDFAVSKNKNGLRADDEAFKKATTDAMTNAMKTIGVAADLHLGMFDDSKYVNAVDKEFREEEKTPQQKWLAKAADALGKMETEEEIFAWKKANVPPADLSDPQKVWYNNTVSKNLERVSNFPQQEAAE